MRVTHFTTLLALYTSRLKTRQLRTQAAARRRAAHRLKATLQVECLCDTKDTTANDNTELQVCSKRGLSVYTLVPARGAEI